ncbi:MAG: ATP-binding protein [Caldilineaceae bacterium]
MQSYTDTELEIMLTDLESDRVERKESFRGDAPQKAREAVCAFANDLPNYQQAGVIFIGATDKGAPAGLSITDDLLTQLADIKTDGNTLPPPTITVTKRTLLGAEVAVILVKPSDSPPVRYRGRIYIRIGPRRGIATAQDERILNEKRRFRDLPFDAQPVPLATIADLNRRSFEEEYLPLAFAPDVLLANERTYEQRLAATKMVATAADPTPTVVGLLTIGNQARDFLPGAYIEFLRVDGTEWTDAVIDNALISGPLPQMIRRLDEKLAAHNRIAVDFTSGPTERRTPTYAPVALQQLTRNALMHRTYEATNAPTRVYWFNNRIEIINPGGPFGIVTPENFGSPGVTDYRNPNIAEAMRVLGFVQRFGFGIQIARAELRKNGQPAPEFEVSPQTVICRIYSRSGK